MPAVNRVTRRDLVTLALVLFVAALMRFGESGIVEFKLDEAWLSRLSLEWLRGGSLPLTGMPSSVGLPNPPVSVYLISLPFALSSNPLVATMFVAALNVAGVGLLWLIAHRYVTRNAALAAGLAYALSPWAVLYSRKIWAQDMHAPFVLLALLLGLVGFREGKRWAQVLCLPVFVIAFQFHFAAWALLPLYIALLWIGRKQVSWRAVGLSVLLALASLIPFAIGLSQTLQAEPNRLDGLRGGQDALTLNSDALRYTAELATGLGMDDPLSDEPHGDLLNAVPTQPQLWALLGILALLGLVVSWRDLRWLAPLLALWALLPLLLFTPTWTPVFPHYFIASIPAYCLLMGVALAWLIAHAPGKPLSRVILLTSLVAILLTQGIWWRGVLRYVDTHEAAWFGTPLYRLLPLRDSLLRSDNVMVLANESNLAYSETAAVWSVLLEDAECAPVLSGTDLLLLPNLPVTVVAAPGSPDALVDVYAQGQPTRYDVPDGQYKVYERDSAPSLEQDEFMDWQARFSNGVTLTGYHVDNDAVRLRWLLPTASHDDFHTFIHLLDANGERIAQSDAAFLAGHYWCAGDTLLTTAVLDVPEAAAALRVGMYVLRGEQFINADLLDSSGNPAASWVDIPLTNSEAP